MSFNCFDNTRTPAAAGRLGAIALIGVFITICNIFIDSGLGNALIQRKEIDELDKSTVFYVNLAVAVVLYGALFANSTGCGALL